MEFITQNFAGLQWMKTNPRETVRMNNERVQLKQARQNVKDVYGKHSYIVPFVPAAAQIQPINLSIPNCGCFRYKKIYAYAETRLAE